MASYPAPDPPLNALWQFEPQGDGGEWSEVPQTSQSNFSSLSRTNNGASTSGNGLGFVLGGAESGQTSKSSGTFASGLVIYNSTSGEWYNVSAAGYSPDGTAFANAAHFVPNFGPNGLLFILGGQVYSSGNDNWATVDAASISIYDPASMQWKTQDSTGSPPPAVQSPCVVGAQGDDGTYEIFLYGGISNEDIDSTVNLLGNVYVLSLPAFIWQRTQFSPWFGRTAHTCNLINRQMIVVGGQIKTVADYEANNGLNYIRSLDPWDQGLGVFDIVDMEWKQGFDASPGPYATPQTVKDVYSQNARYPASLLGDDILKAWFVGKSEYKSVLLLCINEIITVIDEVDGSKKH